MSALSQDDVARIDRVLGVVIENAGEFSESQVDFAMSNASRLDEFKRLTRISPKQWEVIEDLETKIGELGL